MLHKGGRHRTGSGKKARGLRGYFPVQDAAKQKDVEGFLYDQLTCAATGKIPKIQAKTKLPCRCTWKAVGQAAARQRKSMTQGLCTLYEK